jgi:hypothetical protein
MLQKNEDKNVVYWIKNTYDDSYKYNSWNYMHNIPSLTDSQMQISSHVLHKVLLFIANKNASDIPKN